MNEVTPTPTEGEYGDLSRKHSRRAKVASWAAGIMPLSGAAAIAEGLLAQPANAAPASANVMKGHEVQSPQAYLAKTDEEMAKVFQETSSTASPIPIPAAYKNVPFLKDSILYSISIPHANHPGHFDSVSILYDKNVKKAKEIAIAIDTNLSTNNIFGNNAQKGGQQYTLIHYDNSFNYTNTGAILSSDSDFGEGGVDSYYSIGSGAFMGIPAPNVNYSVNPSSVAQQYDKFFQTAQKIINSKHK